MVNFQVRTQAAAYQEGCRDAYELLITALIEAGNVGTMIDVLEDNARPADADRLREYYAAKARKF